MAVTEMARVANGDESETEAVQAEGAADAQFDARYRHLFENSRDAIYMTTRDGSFTDVNGAMLELLGYTREDLLQLNAAELYADASERTRFTKDLERDGYVREHELRLKRKTGEVIVCLKTASVQRTADGVILGYQCILHDITERKRAESELAHTAFHDALTGLPNRALFLDRLERLLRYARRHRSYRFAVLFLDLDRFKLINDSLGHLVGDELLVSVARRLEGCIRAEDTVARLGGDEFAIILDAIQDPSHATRVAERVLIELQRPFTIGAHEIHTGTSIGISLSLTGYPSITHMLEDADAAMYRAKNAGRNRFEVFDTAMHEQAQESLRLERELRRAIDRHQLVLHYLPVYSLKDRRIAGLEALVRWQHPDRGLLLPSDFIEVAEESGLIVPLGWWVLRQACEQMTLWEQQLGFFAEGLTVGVNLSGRQFLQPDLVANIERVLRETRVGPERLRLEIAEKDMMHNADAALAVLEQLHNRGIRIIMDDFGTGYSSLSYLTRFPIHGYKIDRSFVRDLGLNRHSEGLVRSMLALGNSMDLVAIAEGVEAESQVDQLQQFGVDFAQGFLLSAPVDGAAIAELLQR